MLVSHLWREATGREKMEKVNMTDPSSWDYGSTNKLRHRGAILFHGGKTPIVRAVGGLLARGWGYQHALCHANSWRGTMPTWSADSDFAYASGIQKQHM